VLNKNIMDMEKNGSILVGDPYKSELDQLPGRWREKQFQGNRIAQNAGDGYFGNSQMVGKGGKAFTYVSDPFVEQMPYQKTQPADKRKLGFGTHDAARRDEFAQTIRTEQYRETLRAEQKLLDGQRNEELENSILAKAAKSMAARTFVEGKSEISALYDVGRTCTTEFDPHYARDQFYNISVAYTRPKRMGSLTSSSSAIGEGCWGHKYSKPEHGSISPTKTFYDRSHLRTTGF
jgi:hypothetical protein